MMLTKIVGNVMYFSLKNKNSKNQAISYCLTYYRFFCNASKNPYKHEILIYLDVKNV